MTRTPENPIPENPIIVALDVPSAEEARALVRSLGDAAGFYKVGLELFPAAGPDFVRELIGEGKRVFLDLKMYDIQETVRRAVQQVARLGPDFLTIHGIPAVMRAAVEGRGDSKLKLLAVTVLTSFDDADVAEMGYPHTLRALVEKKTTDARAAGVDGMITSPREVARVRELAGPAAILVTPGVRSAGADRGDQKRVATPEEAVAAGASYVVMGRQIARAKDPRGEALRVLDEWRPDIMLSDMSRGEDGYLLIRAVRALPAERGGCLRAAAITGTADSAAVAAGYDAQLAKPVEPVALLATVARLVQPAGV